MTDNTALAAEQAAGLRKLADAVEANPDLAPHLRYALSFSTHIFNDVPATFAAFARAAKAAGAKVTKDYHGKFAHVLADWGGVSVDLQTDRDEVCERVVVDTREIVEEVPDPVAVAALPKVKQTRVEEIVEWKCRPILAADDSAALAGTAAAS